MPGIEHQPKNAVAAIRVSTTGQGTDGDSPEAQKEQIERYAESKGITIKQYFVFLESASKEQQPMQAAIDYCKDPKNNIQLFIIKSIDRFTRGGSLPYDSLKAQLDVADVALVDIYGIISSQKVNTLEHLGVKYKWSVYSPSKKAEILEAERANDEIRDIMSRMIGAEIRYVRMGYWVRSAPYGFVTEKVETPNGRRTILVPHKTEAMFVQKMYEFRARGTMSDKEIVEKINQLGYISRVNVRRDKNDRTKILKTRGGQPLSLKTFWRIVEHPIYAGINDEEWLQDGPQKCKFDGLVSVDLYNMANKGKRYISEQNGVITIGTRPPAPHLVNKGVKDAEFPFKKQVLCPHCEKPLYGSASRGKLGKYYSAYHCNRGHYYRISQKEFDETIEEFVKSIQISPEYLEELNKLVVTEWKRRDAEKHQESKQLKERIMQLQAQAQGTADKFKFLSSETAIKYLEDELVKTENEIKELKAAIQPPSADEKEPDINVAMKYITYFCQNLEHLVLGQENKAARAGYFGVLFDKAPTYDEIKLGTPKLAAAIELNRLFQLKNRGDDSEGQTIVDSSTSLLEGLLDSAQTALRLDFRTPKKAVSNLLKRPCELPNSGDPAYAGLVASPDAIITNKLVFGQCPIILLAAYDTPLRFKVEVMRSLMERKTMGQWIISHNVPH